MNFWKDGRWWITDDGITIFYDNNVGVNTDSGDTLTANLTVKSEPAQIPNALDVKNSANNLEAWITPVGSGSLNRLAVGNDEGSIISQNNIINVNASVGTVLGEFNGVRGEIAFSSVGNAATKIVSGVLGQITSTHTEVAVGNSATSSVTGINFHFGSGALSILRAGTFVALAFPGSGAISQFRGLTGTSTNLSANVVGQIGIEAQVTNFGSTLFTEALLARIFRQTGGTTTTLSGIRIGRWSTPTGTSTNVHGLLIDTTVDAFVGTGFDPLITNVISNWAIRSFSTKPSALTGQLFASGYGETITTKAVSYVATVNDAIILTDTTAGDVTITLPDPGIILPGRKYKIKQIAGTNNTIIISAAGLVEQAGSYTITEIKESATFHTSNFDWFLFACCGRAILATDITCPIRTEVANYNVVVSDFIILLDGTAGAVVGTLPAIGTVPVGKKYTLKKIDATANAVSVSGNGVDIDFGPTWLFSTPGEGINIVSDGSQWWRI